MNRPPNSSDDLDLLLDATDAFPDTAATDRLLAFYKAERRQATFRRVAPVALMAAAAVIAFAFLPLRIPTTTRQEARLPAVVEPVVVRSKTVSREPSVAEQMALFKSMASTRTKPLDQPEMPTEDPEIARLFAALKSPRLADRLVAASELGARADGAAVERLIALTQSPASSREATVALLASPRTEAKAFLASREARPLLSLVRSLELTPPRPQSRIVPHTSFPENL